MFFKTILVPIDFSENAQLALETGCRLAEQLGSKLHVLHVQDERLISTAMREGLLRADLSDEELQREISQLHAMRFSTALAGPSKADVIIEQVVRRGDADSEIVEYANEVSADLIVIGMRGTSAANMIREVVAGSVATSVIRKSPCPVLVVRLDHVARS